MTEAGEPGGEGHPARLVASGPVREHDGVGATGGVEVGDHGAPVRRQERHPRDEDAPPHGAAMATAPSSVIAIVT
jgi:hypothetical protein